ncbi:MAG TPA: hypothetical protein VFG20_08915 [Planctomycetaceae bacterium]|nr:hypothetical protein [Planctomycetaceae bacterium]
MTNIIAWGFLLLAADPVELPDLRSIPADLTTPTMTSRVPAPGWRVRGVLTEFTNSAIYHTLYLPTDWQSGRRYPVIVEYPGNGNYRNQYGDVSDGMPEGCHLGYGLTAGVGAIWVCLPFVEKTDEETRNAVTWWGGIAETKRYCRLMVDHVCRDWGGDHERVFLAGFSRGAIAGNFIGLHDDEIAKLWAGFFLYSHYDGVKPWPYPESDRDAALLRLKRLGTRPQFIAHEGRVDSVADYLMATGVAGRWTFQAVPFRNHSAEWILRDNPARDAARKWWKTASTTP